MASGQKINSSTFQTRWDSLCLCDIGKALMCPLILFFRWKNLVVPDGTRLINAELNFNFLTRKSSIVIARVHRHLLCLTLLLWHLLCLEKDVVLSPWTWTVTTRKQPFRFKSHSFLPFLFFYYYFSFLISCSFSVWLGSFPIQWSLYFFFISILRSAWSISHPDSYHDCHDQLALDLTVLCLQS